MKRADALAEARRRWGEHAWVRFRMPNPPRQPDRVYQVGFGGDDEKHQRTVGSGTSWEAALADADALLKQTGLTHVYRLGRERHVIRVVYGARHPALVDQVRALAAAAEHGVGQVEWRYQINGGTLATIFFQLCGACGNPTRGERCSVCRAIDDMLLDDLRQPGQPRALPDDVQARYEASERYMDRIAAVIAELKRQLGERLRP